MMPRAELISRSGAVGVQARGEYRVEILALGADTGHQGRAGRMRRKFRHFA